MGAVLEKVYNKRRKEYNMTRLGLKQKFAVKPPVKLGVQLDVCSKNSLFHDFYLLYGS